MALFDMGEYARVSRREASVFDPNSVPKEMDIFFRTESDFLPEGKTSFDQLTPVELEQLKNMYRFSPYRPGIYQAITGLGNMML